MYIDLKIPLLSKIAQDALLFKNALEFQIHRPTQAWQWMNQSRAIPDQNDWVRSEVIESWRRCYEEYQLPLGTFSNWDDYPILRPALPTTPQTAKIEALIKQLSLNFHVFLKEAGIMMLLTAADGRLLHVVGERQFPGGFMAKMHSHNANWHESILGNNGIGTAAALKRPIAFQGMEHFLNVLHPFTTVGYPLMDESGELLAVIGLISDHQESMNSLFAFLHLVCVLVNTNLPLAKNPLAQEQVLKKIPFKPAKKIEGEFDGSAMSPELEALLQKAVKLQTYKIPILITGESGVGKDHFVNLLKHAGPRKNNPLIAINCASIPHDLIESELFGYEAGSFTGAKNSGKPGKFLLADTGILFLDEIGDMSFDLQSTLLRVLETSEFTPVGGNKPIHVDVQVVAATNVQLLEAVEAGRFRRDLYYRLNGAQIHLLPLRERKDKQAIIQSILQRELQNLPAELHFDICPEVMAIFGRHPWPGNIRQLINVIRATLYSANSCEITQQDLPLDFLSEIQQSQDCDNQGAEQSVFEQQINAISLLDWELHGIKTALKNCEGNISMAAKLLGITRSTLYKKIERFGLNKSGSILAS